MKGPFLVLNSNSSFGPSNDLSDRRKAYFLNTSIKGIPRGLMLLLAVSSGVIAANLYYSQPILNMMHSSVGLSQHHVSFIVTITQIGYGLGLLLIVPAGDLIENKRLIITMLSIVFLSLVSLVFIHHTALFLIASAFIGIGASAAQIIVPYAAYLSPVEKSGQAIGTVMSGLLLGIMLARPLSSLMSDIFGWKSIFILSAGLIFLLVILLVSMLPKRNPSSNMTYPVILKSMVSLLKNTPVLRIRAFCHACAFAGFSLFWTAVPFQLSSPAFQFSQKEIAIFALIGVAGAAASPLAGKWADKGWDKVGTSIAFVFIIIAFLMPYLFPENLFILVGAAILLDMGVSMNLIFSQREVLALSAEKRSRLNGLFMSIFFMGGALGSAIGGWAYYSYNWQAVMVIGLCFPILAFFVFIYSSLKNKSLRSREVM